MPYPADWLGIPFKIMGIVNCTPDSFSDGGLYNSPEPAIKKALQLCAEGADIIDLGAESTRPGASPVSVEDEWRRLEPVISGLKGTLPAGVRLSVDTRKPDIMLRAAESGADFINNVEGLAPLPVLQKLSAIESISYIGMHMSGSPEMMQQKPLQGMEGFLAVREFFAACHSSLLACGFSEERIWLDPGIGFGKDDQANLILMGQTPFFAKKYKMVLGVSRKSWLGRCLEIDRPVERDAPSKIAELALGMAGAGIIRTHAVKHLAYLRGVLYKPDS